MPAPLAAGLCLLGAVAMVDPAPIGEDTLGLTWVGAEQRWGDEIPEGWEWGDPLLVLPRAREADPLSRAAQTWGVRVLRVDPGSHDASPTALLAALSIDKGSGPAAWIALDEAGPRVEVLILRRATEPPSADDWLCHALDAALRPRNEVGHAHAPRDPTHEARAERPSAMP